VYGDIGTSPLYAFNEVFFGSGQLAVTPEHVAGAASLIFWLLVIFM
jgi:KUP system potassium uptake protein